MPRAVKKKIFKAKRKEIDGSKDQYIIRWKNLEKDEIKALRIALDECCSDFLEPARDTRSEY